MEDVVTKYTVDVSDFSAKFTEMENRLKTQEAAFASLGKQGKESFKGTADEADKLKEKISGGLSDAVNRIGTYIISAFAIQKIISFGEESVRAFAAAELAATKLNFAVTKVLGGTQSQFDELIKSSETLAKKTFFTPAQIQQAQAFTTIVGLSVKNTKEAVPRIADLAVALSQASGQTVTLEEATRTFDTALAGNTRQLRQIGAEFKDTGSKVGNFNAFMEATTKINGLAEQALNTTAGRMQKMSAESEILKESIGQKIAPALLSAKLAALEFAESLAEIIFKETELEKFNKQVAIATDELSKSKSTTIELEREHTESVKHTAELIAKRNNLEAISASNKIFGGDNSETLKNLKAVNDELNNELRFSIALGNVINKRGKDEQEAKQETLRLAGLEKIQKEDISKLSAKSLTDEIAQLKLRNDAATIEIKDEIIRRLSAIKIVEEAEKKATDQRLHDAEAASQKLAQLRIESETKATISGVATDPIKKLDAEYDAELIGAVRIFNLSKKSAKDRENLKATLAAIEIFYENKISDETIKIHQGELDAQASIDDEQIKMADALGDRLDKIGEEEEKRRKENFDAILNSAQNLAGQLNSLFDAQGQAQIQLVNQQRDATLQALDDQLAAAEDANSKHHLSDKKLAALKKQIAAEQKAANKKAADEEKKLQHEAAVRNKELTIFNIILSTAEAIINAFALKPPNPFLAALAGVTGAIELGIAIATPIPALAKGTKSATQGISLVGERGPELIFVPSHSKVLPAQQTKTYADAIEAMRENRLEEYVFKTYVIPQLAIEKQKSQIQNSSEAMHYAMREIKLDRRTIERLNSNRTVHIDNLDELAEYFTEQNPRRKI